MYDAGEISRRTPVWSALAELYLDTELTETELAEIAHTISSAGFSVNEAREILRNEVAPVVWTNLFQIAGEWQPWNPEQLQELVLARLDKNRKSQLFPAFAEFWCECRLLTARSDWRRISRQLENGPHGCPGG